LVWQDPASFLTNNRHGRPVIDDAQRAGCDQQRAGTPNHTHGVPALPLVTPYKITNSIERTLPSRHLYKRADEIAGQSRRFSTVEATGLSEDMLSHVFAGRKHLAIDTLEESLHRIGYALHIVPSAKHT